MHITIGVSGSEGSFSEEAAQYYCQKNNIVDYELRYLISVENVLNSLIGGKIDRGVFPIENSNGGIVYEAIYAMAKHTFSIENIFEIDVKHNLMALPGVAKEDIKKIASHDQALKQCRMYLKRRWQGAELIEWSDTAQAAKDLSAGVLPSNAAVIAPKRAAELYDLEILEESIQDLKFNFTTFILAAKK
ncbi:MAG: prephenate dehydratase domain-containing protein [bacterium]|nr:prephenate dehydratase domain-containing protein [bacterium]